MYLWCCLLQLEHSQSWNESKGSIDSLRRLLNRKCSEWEQDGGKVGFKMARL